MHHEQDMRFYGGLRKSIPLTFWTMMAGTLAITGVGIAEVFGFAGFYSKDAIIEATYACGTEAGYVAFSVAVFAALLTSFYSWRLMFLTFWGAPRWVGSEHIQHALHDAHDQGDDPSDEHGDSHHGAVAVQQGTGGYHPHESPLSMLVPLVLLSVGAVFAGYAFHGVFLDPERGAAFWHGSVAFDEHLMHAMHGVPALVKLSATIVMLIGLAFAWLAYIRDPELPARVTDSFSGPYRFLLNKWYFDELYDRIFVRPAFAFGRLFWHGGDERIIDRFGPNGAASLVAEGSRLAVRFQSGYLYTYALVMLLGLAAAATWAISNGR